MEVAALDGSLYYVSLLDDYSKLLAVTLIRQKSDAAAAIIDMVTALERQTGSKLKVLRSDRGGEYTGAELQRWLRTQGVVHQLTAPYSPEMNGSAERAERRAQAQAEVQRLRDVEQSLMGTVDGLQGDLDDLQAAHQRLQGATHNSVAKRASAARLACGESA
ncbi:hypothetical protein QJQ45_010442 [Haematococcus lacustris]|nr:hypothetical protein QJQ45_010442 [Haematococcus lacustris]